MQLRALVTALLPFVALAVALVAPVPGATREASAAPTDAGADAGPPVPACISVTSTSRWVPYAYDHIVTLTNGCSRDATCQVSTDVNPTPTTASVAKGTTVDVVTFMGSPSATFNARVRCALR